MSNDWENPKVLAINRLPSRTSGFSHPTREGAYEEDPGTAWAKESVGLRLS